VPFLAELRREFTSAGIAAPDGLAVTSTPSATAGNTASTAGKETTKGLSNGALAGILLASLPVAALVSYAGFKKYSNRRSPQGNQPPGPVEFESVSGVMELPKPVPSATSTSNQQIEARVVDPIDL
jgi:hypothetical protein